MYTYSKDIEVIKQMTFERNIDCCFFLEDKLYLATSEFKVEDAKAVQYKILKVLKITKQPEFTTEEECNVSLKDHVIHLIHHSDYLVLTE